MKKYLFPIFAALLLCSCQNALKTEVCEDDFVLPLAEGRADSLWMYTNVEYPVGGAPETVLKTLREQLGDVLFGGLEKSDDIPARAVQYRQEAVEDYLAEYLQSAPDTSDHRNMTWTRRKSGKFVAPWKDFYCYEEEVEEIWGGGQPFIAHLYFVFDGKDGSLVEEHEFFKDGYEDPVREILGKHLLSDIVPQLEKDGFDSNPVKYLVEEGGAWPNGVYLPGKDGVTWAFQPEEVAPMSYGVIPVTVPWEELEGLLR